MSGLLLALSLIAGRVECEALTTARKNAFNNGDYQRCYDLIEQEIECITRSYRIHPPANEPGSLRSLCLRIDAGFHVALDGEHDPELAQDYLRRYEEHGCLHDPLQRPRHRANMAQYQRTKLDTPGALRHLRQGETEAAVSWFRNWDAPDRWSLLWSIANSMALRAEIAAELRRPDDLLIDAALFILDSVDPALSKPEVADVRNLLGWSMLMAHEAGVETEDPTDLLRDALHTFVVVRSNPHKANNTQINLALAALQHRGPSEAEAWIEEIERSERCVDELSEEQRMWLRIIAIRSAIARDDDPRRSAQWQDDLERLGEGDGVTLGRWYAQASAGQRYEAMGHIDSALRAYAQAEAELENFASSRPDATDAVLEARRHLTFSRSTRRMVALLCERGEDEEALRVVRAARSRVLRVADASRAGAQSLPNTDRPKGDKLVLVFFQTDFQTSAVAEDGTSRGVGFALTADGPRSEPFELDPVPDDLFKAQGEDLQGFTTALLEPFSAEIEAAGSIEILATGSLHHVPFHALPWRDGTLIEHVPLTYGLDLDPASAEDRAVRPGAPLVLHGNEEGLADEADAVIEALTRGDTVPIRSSPDSAELLDKQLKEASIAHFAVHGTRTEDHQLLRSDDRLHFRPELELSRDAILDGEAAPKLVYLSACQSSFADAETLSGGVGLTQAFLLRGAHYVIGAVDDIDEEVAKDFAVAFYSALGDTDGDVPSAWQRAYVDMLKRTRPSLLPDLQMLRLYSR